MKRREIITSLIMIMIFWFTTATFADVVRDRNGLYHWGKLGGDPRKAGGLHSWREYFEWFFGPGGQNDLTRLKIPPVVREKMDYMVKSRMIGKEIEFSDGCRALMVKKTVLPYPNSPVYRSITYGDGKVIENVVLDVPSTCYHIQIFDALRNWWVLETHSVCANSGLYTYTIITFTPRLPTPEEPLPPPEVVKRYYQLEEAPKITAARAKEGEIKYESIFDGWLGRALAAWLSKPVYNNVTKVGGNVMNGGSPVSYSFGGNPTANGGAANVGPVSGGSTGPINTTATTGPTYGGSSSATSTVSDSGNSTNTINGGDIDIQNTNNNGNSNVNP